MGEPGIEIRILNGKRKCWCVERLLTPRFLTILSEYSLNVNFYKYNEQSIV